MITSGIEEQGPQQTGCVPNGGGGSLIGDPECSSDGVVQAKAMGTWLMTLLGTGVVALVGWL